MDQRLERRLVEQVDRSSGEVLRGHGGTPPRPARAAAPRRRCERQPVGGQLHRRARDSSARLRGGRPVFQSTTSTPSPSVGKTASTRPRTSTPATNSSNGASTSTGVRPAHSMATNASCRDASSRSWAAPSSAASGQLVDVEQAGLPHRASSQAWNSVPRRASGVGGRGTGRRGHGPAPAGRRAAGPAGTPTVPGQRDLDRALGGRPVPLGEQRPDLVVPLGCRAMISASASRSAASPLSSAARTSAAPSSTAARRPRRAGRRATGRRDGSAVSGLARRVGGSSTQMPTSPAPASQASRISSRNTDGPAACSCRRPSGSPSRRAAAAPGSPRRRRAGAPRAGRPAARPARTRRDRVADLPLVAPRRPARAPAAPRVAAQREWQRRPACPARPGRLSLPAGNTPSTRPATNTTSHSRPLAPCTVSTCTPVADDLDLSRTRGPAPRSRPHRDRRGRPTGSAPPRTRRTRGHDSRNASRLARPAPRGRRGPRPRCRGRACVRPRRPGRAAAGRPVVRSARSSPRSAASRSPPSAENQPSRRQRVERVDDARRPRRRSVEGRVERLRPSVGQRPRPRARRDQRAPERVEVARPDAPARAGQQAHERVAAAGSASTRSVATTSADLRRVEQTADTDHLAPAGRARSAASSRGIWDRLRTSTAAVAPVRRHGASSARARRATIGRPRRRRSRCSDATTSSRPGRATTCSTGTSDPRTAAARPAGWRRARMPRAVAEARRQRALPGRPRRCGAGSRAGTRVSVPALAPRQP